MSRWAQETLPIEDCTLNGGLKVTLTLSQTSVPADGLTVIKGEIRTTEFGKPQSSVTVSPRPEPSETSKAAITSGARAALCDSAGTRISPTGALLTPYGTPVEVQTDADGVYDFTMTVGTVRGRSSSTPGPRMHPGT
jgi:hypothetical protein